MSRTLPSTLRDLALAIRSHSNAWASARDTANKAHLAAVTGKEADALVTKVAQCVLMLPDGVNHNCVIFTR